MPKSATFTRTIRKARTFHSPKREPWATRLKLWYFTFTLSVHKRQRDISFIWTSPHSMNSIKKKDNINKHTQIMAVCALEIQCWEMRAFGNQIFALLVSNVAFREFRSRCYEMRAFGNQMFALIATWFVSAHLGSRCWERRAFGAIIAAIEEQKWESLRIPPTQVKDHVVHAIARLITETRKDPARTCR